ncbi:tudor domain-containing protein 15 isoform X2 [Trachinotus anak]|uniref:tudor domain-containing protein 15 isoform X2 n=1 Tax=Trachinotus anak TaxID=443729 RepID=UPI0039F25A1B
MGSEHQNSRDSGPSVPCALWPVDLKLTHLDWNPEATLIHFQGQYLTICELDYNILQGEIQNIAKRKAAVDIGEFCLVEDLASARWYRGRVQNQKDNLFDVFLIDHGNVLSVDIAHISSCSNDLLILPPKIVSGFIANVLLLQGCSHSVVEQYFSSLIGRNVTGYIQALLPHKVLLLEVPDINGDLVRHGFGRHVDTDTFLFLVEMLTEVPLKQNVQLVPDLHIEKPRGQELRFKPSCLQGYEDILSFCGPRLSCGTRAKVRVTAAVNPGLFYCQMTSMETDLWEMSKKLAAVCEYRTKAWNQKPPENLGLLCSVKGKDGKWYRGFVQFLPNNSQVRVLFIDYGFFESVKVENVHRLPSNLYSTPIMAFPCSLFSLSDQDEVIKTQQLSFLKAGLLGGVLEMEISSFDEEQYLYSITFIGVEDNRVKELEPIQELPRMEVEFMFETEEFSPQGRYLYHETIMGEALGKTLKAEQVQVDSVFVGYCEHVQNPNHFWIRTQKRNDEFEEMMTKMTDHFSQVKLDEDVLSNPQLGTMCCAVYEEDMHFYRGVVTDTLEHGAEVLFIDFGNIEKVPHMLIKNIPEEFASESAFAFCCTLVNVLPLDEVWTSTTSDFFRRAVSNKALLVNVVQMRKNKFVVDLYEMGSDNNQSITDLLISSKQAEYWNNVSIEPVMKNSTDVTEKRRCLRYNVTSDISLNTEKLDDYGEENMCKNEVNKAQGPASFRALSIKPGCEFAVHCSYINSPSDFWCQPQDNVQALEELMDKVQQYYSTNTVPLQSGVSCCVAKSPQDGRWYRAFITEKQNGYARVMLVDYGFTIQVKDHNLQAIIPEYVYLEGQAFRCSFSNLIEPTDSTNCGDWSLEVCNSVKDFILNSNHSLKCKVVSQLNVKNKGLCNAVDLYNTQTHQSITNWLMDQGMAREATVSTKQLSTVSPESFVYSSYDLSSGNQNQVFVTHVSSQWEVYCHLEINTEIIEDLEKKILEESEKMMQASTRAVVRKLCLAKYFDGKWYRGLAHPVQSPLHLSVFFVDYGNTTISEKTHVMFLPRDSADLLYTPMQAVRCCLASVSKEELYADVKEWLEGAILNKQVKAVILGKNEDGSFEVELFDGDVNISEKIKELILNLSPKPQTNVCFDTSRIKRKHKVLHPGNTKILLKYKSQPEGQSSKSPTWNPHRGTQVGNAPQKRCVHGKTQNKNTKVKQQNEDKTKSCVPVKSLKNSKVKQQTEHQDTNTKSEQPQHNHNNETEIPQLSRLPDKVSAGLKAKCFVSHIGSVNNFFLQLSEDEPAILKMGDDLNSGIFKNSLETATSLRINDLVLAVYEEDGALYRSVVKDYEGRYFFKIEFVDYGNSAVVGKENIFLIPKEYLSQPRFSISCSLLDTSTYESDASFTDAVIEKPLMVDFVRQCGTQWEVKVEILDVAFPTALESAVESSPVNENKASTSDNKTSNSETKIPIVQGENVTLKTPGVNLSTKLKVKTCSCHRRRPTTDKSHSKRNRRKASTSSVKSMRDLADAFTHLTVHAKDRKNGTILSVQSNADFYIRLARTRYLLAALESHIAENLHKCKMMVEEDVKRGLQCLVQVHKDKWQRAVVKHVGGEKCKVLLVDHGITEEIPSDLIRQQCGYLKKIPNLTVLCKMNCFGFSEVEDAHKLWCETLKPMIGKEVNLLFVRYSEADNIWMVEIVMNGLSLIQEITTSVQQNQEMFPLPTETQNKATEEEPNLDTDPPQQLTFAPIDIDKVYFGFAATVQTPFEFCVVLEDLLLIVNKVSIMLENLCGQMSPLPEAHLVHGTCCLLKSDSKNKWCRSEIVLADTTVVLNLVDYGCYESMRYKDHSKLKRLPEELMKLPKVTYPCILRGVKPVEVDEQWTDEAAVFFQQCLYQKNLQIFFREFVSNTHWKVDILADGVHVAKELVDAGHANYIDAMLELRFQEERPCTTPPQGPDSEEEFGQGNEGSHGRSDLSTEATEEAGGKKSLSALSGSSVLM